VGWSGIALNSRIALQCEWGQKRLRREKIVVNSRKEQSRRNSMAGFGHPIPGPGEVGVE
jgi:hypothetical protein